MDSNREARLHELRASQGRDEGTTPELVFLEAEALEERLLSFRRHEGRADLDEVLAGVDLEEAALSMQETGDQVALVVTEVERSAPPTCSKST